MRMLRGCYEETVAVKFQLYVVLRGNKSEASEYVCVCVCLYNVGHSSATALRCPEIGSFVESCRFNRPDFGFPLRGEPA